MSLRFRKALFLVVFFSFTSVVVAQLEEALEVETSIKKVSKNVYELRFEYFIEEGWHLYSQFNAKGGSEPLKIKAKDKSQTGFVLVGKADESEMKPHKEFNSDFGVEETFFVDEAVFVQKIKVTDKNLKNIEITVSGQACMDSCLPYYEDFTFKIPKKKKKTEKKSAKSSNSSLSIDPKILIGGGVALLVLIVVLFFVFRKKK